MHYLGLDVAEASLELSDSAGRLRRSFKNSDAGLRRLVGFLSSRYSLDDVQLVVEPTSTYHQRLVSVLAAQGIAYSLVNPARAAYYARASMSRAKTDASDARMLARLGESEELPPSPPPDEARERLRMLVRHRELLLAEARSWRCRLGAAKASVWAPDSVTRSIRWTIDSLEHEAARMEEQVWELAGEDAGLMRQIALLKTAPGIGEKTALSILVEMPPVSECRSAKAWAAFAGLVPALQQSGKQSFSSLSRRGASRVRAALYMPAVVAMRRNPAVRSFAQRLQERGKQGLRLITALMHKLIRICFGILRSGQAFDPARHERIATDGRTPAPRQTKRAAAQVRTGHLEDPGPSADGPMDTPDTQPGKGRQRQPPQSTPQPKQTS